MRLVKLTMVEYPGTVENVIRPYEMDFKQRYVDDIANATEGGLRLTPHRLSRVASGILAPSADRGLISHIPNGWGEKRIMFAMVVEVLRSDRQSEYNYIVGMTDHAGYSALGTKVNFDPNMKMYFNTITRVSLLEAANRGNRVWQPRIQAHDQVLNREAIIGSGRGRRHERPATQRPCDLFRRIDSNLGFSGMFQGQEGDKNFTGTLTSQLRLSSLSNNDPTLFVSRGLKAFSKASGDPTGAFFDDVDDKDAIQATVDELDENVIDQNPYISEVLRRQTNILENGYVTFGELMEMNPDFDEDRQLPFKPLRGDSRMGMDHLGSWTSSEPETIAATLIAQALPVVMINAMYSKVDNLIFNSRARIGQPKVLAGTIFPFVDGLEVRHSLDYFEGMCENILTSVSKNGLFSVDARINANIDQSIDIWLTLDDGEEAFYSFPAFASAFTAPTLSDSGRHLDVLSKQFLDLSNGVVRRAQREAPGSIMGDRPDISLSTDYSSSFRGEDRSADDRDDLPSFQPRTKGRDW